MSEFDKKNPQNFKNDFKDNFKKNNQINSADGEKIDEIIETLRKLGNIRPINNQQRNLDREEGGLEEEIKEQEIHADDVWDERGSEVMKMGKKHPINSSSGKKSMLWNLKRKLLQNKLLKKELEEVSDDLRKAKLDNDSRQDGAKFDSRKEQSFTQKISALKQDRTDFKPPTKIR